MNLEGLKHFKAANPYHCFVKNREHKSVNSETSFP